MSTHDFQFADEVAIALGADPFIAQSEAFDIAGGKMTITFGDEEHSMNWHYDGGAGGTATGTFRSLADVGDWLKANADAIT